jgi:rhodanese-related sulfurtransferase
MQSVCVRGRTFAISSLRKHIQTQHMLFFVSSHRFYSSNTKEPKLINKEELRKLIEKKEEPYVLIDVRNPDEVTSPDMPLIESAVNIPLPDLGSAFMMMDEKRFKTSYGFPKPKHHEKIIVYCRSGKRSTQAADILRQMQYDNVFNYVGSAMDWYSEQKQ